jgi:hypothetical protein
MEELFNIEKDNIEEITISKTNAGNNCLIHDAKNKLDMYQGFLLKETEKTKRICCVSFYPSSKNNKFIPRLEFKILNKDNTIKTTNKDQRIAFSTKNEGLQEFWKMILFLGSFKDFVDTDEFYKKYQVVNTNDYINFIKTKNDADKINEIDKLVTSSGISVDEIISGLKNSKKEILKQFEYMMKDPLKKEEDWEIFFKANKWILGLNIDVRFVRDFYYQANIGIQNTISKGSPHGDMLGINDYTSLVEIKTPFTKIFTNRKKETARTNTWSFTDFFIDGISQCLAQKSEADKRLKSKDIIDDEKKVVDQNKIRTRDIKSVFIIGNKSLEIPEDSMDLEIQTKRDTLELFRRNNRNVEIITYDELYEKTKKIIELN